MRAFKVLTYSECTRQLDHISKTKGMVFGLENSFKFDAALGRPSAAFQSVHVAGTNGKGSVAGKIARSLSLSGYKTGLYTSPHLLDYCERVEIDGKKISQEEFAELISEGLALQQEKALQATAFELLTIMSFLHFKRKLVDLVVTEVGLGGRLDTTNIITPKLSVITSIGYDHMNLLGYTLEEIAREKAGIIKPGVPVVVGPHAPLPLLQEVAQSNKSECISVAQSSQFENADQENSRIAKVALERLKTDFSKLTDENITKGLSYKPAGRKHTLTCGKATVVIDTGHNRSALSRLFHDLENEFPKYRFQAIMGLSADKEVYGCVEEVMKHVEKVHFVSTDAPRLLHFRKLWQVGMEIDPYVVGASGEVKDVVGPLLDAAESRQLYVICGSFFFMEAVEAQLKLRGASLL